MIVNTDSLFEQAIEDLSSYSSWTVDVETNGLDAYGYNQLCGIGIAIDRKSDSTYYFPFRHQQSGNLNPSYLPTLMDLMSTRTELLGYNLKFDLRFLTNDGLDISNTKLIDVMLLVRLTADSTVNELGLTKTLTRFYGPQAAEYDIETKKYLRSNKWHKDFSLAPPDVLGEYCEYDAYWTLHLYKDCLGKIEQSNQQKILELEYELTRVLFDMESRGVIIDSQYAQQTIKKIEERKIEVEAKIFELSGKEFNIRSTQEIGTIFNDMEIYSNVLTNTGRQSWGTAALAQINHPLAGFIRQHRALTKLSSTYLEPYIEKPVLHTNFCNWGTLTGRLSSREPNLQNIPRNHFNLRDRKLSAEELEIVQGRIEATANLEEGVHLDNDVLNTWGFMGDESYDESDDRQVSIRRLFLPREGYQLVSFDYSQMEVRVFLSYLQNDSMQDLLNRTDVDFHGEAAKIAFELDEDDPQFKYYRQMAKGITFGIIYGIGNQRLAQQLQTTKQEAGKYKKRYLDSIEGSREFIRGVMKAVESRGWIKNKYGRVYKIPSGMSYKGVNYLVQGTSADILNERLIKVDEFLQGKLSKPLLQVHDEIICEVHEDEMDEVVPEIINIMQTNSLGIPLFVDKEVCTPSWATKMDYEDYVTSYADSDTLKKITKTEGIMPKITSHLGVTMNVGKDGSNQYARLDITISDIDTEIPLEPQLEDSNKVIDAVYQATKEKLSAQIRDLRNRNSDKD